MKATPLSASLAGLMCLSLAACAQSAADSATQALFSEQRLQLQDHAGQCRLIGEDGGLDLLLKWPCQFHRDPQGKLRTQQVGSTQVLLVESSEPDEPPSRDCDTTLQAIRTTEQGLEASTVVSRVAACPPFQWDEKVFIGLFEAAAQGS
ncbi:hypothetical protein NDO41_12745 [Ectopseudomonas mendocina]|nr:hypothetical protein NDO41_12745 [Pseudomonas mendocina]